MSVQAGQVIRLLEPAMSWEAGDVLRIDRIEDGIVCYSSEAFDGECTVECFDDVRWELVREIPHGAECRCQRCRVAAWGLVGRRDS